MKRFDLYIGHNYDNGASTWAPETVLEEIATWARCSGIQGFTLTSAEGYWKGQPEHTTIVTLFSFGLNESPELQVKAFAAGIREALRQECVLVVSSPVQTALVTP